MAAVSYLRGVKYLDRETGTVRKEGPVLITTSQIIRVRSCIQKFPDWSPGARTENGIALCH